MKYLKKYKQLLESKEIPGNYIILNSIGHVLDPDSGLIYAIFKKGGYDKENGYEIDDEVIDSLSDEERKEVESYISTGEDIFNERVDSDLINDVDDILLNITDMIREYDDPSYGDWVEAGTINIWYHRVYSDRESIGFNKLWPAEKRTAKKGNVIYTFRIYDITSFTNKITSGKAASLSLLSSETINLSDDKKVEIVSTIIDTLTRLVFYLKNKGYEFHINGMGEHLNTLPSGDIKSRLDNSVIPYEEALRKSFKNNLAFGAFNQEICIMVTHP